jgi:aspartate 1-decarboxylase
MTAGTTSSTTFKARGGAGSGTYTFNGTNGARVFGGSYVVIYYHHGDCRMNHLAIYALYPQVVFTNDKGAFDAQGNQVTIDLDAC